MKAPKKVGGVQAIPSVPIKAGSTELKAVARLTILEFAEIFGFTPTELISGIERNRFAIKRPFYSIRDLAARWRCSRGAVYNVLRESEFKLLDLCQDGKKKGKRLVPSAAVERIEQSRMRSLSDALASEKAA